MDSRRTADLLSVANPAITRCGGTSSRMWTITRLVRELKPGGKETELSWTWDDSRRASRPPREELIVRHRHLVTVLAAATLIAGPLLVNAQAALPQLPAAPRVPAAALPGTTPTQIFGAQVIGPAPLGARRRVTLVLALHDQAGLDQLLHEQTTAENANYRRWLTSEEFTARFSPTQEAVSAAVAWARSGGLTVDSVSPNRTLVTLTGSTEAVNRTFGVHEQTVAVGMVRYLTPDRPAIIPAAVRQISAAVLGLSTYNPAVLALHTRSRAAGKTYALSSYGPRDFAGIYNAPSTVTGTGQRVAVITQGDLTSVIRDLATFQVRNGLPRVPLAVIQTTAMSPDVSGADEYDLDTQYSSGFAPGVNAVLAYNSDTLGDVHPLNRFVTDNMAKTASASYGGCEVLNALGGEQQADDQVFQQADVQGQSFFVSSGDAGSACSLLVNTGTPAGVPDVEYPASSRYVVAVGGTSLTGQSAQPVREIAWIGGGGGYSVTEEAPDWQAAAGAFTPMVGRGVPDVSLDADPNSGYVVVVNGVSTVIGGTSASAPAWNGIWARVLQADGQVGFAAPALYRARGGITDITVGSNGMYQAIPGYDLATGRGSVNITALMAALK